jgi:hypothetical protein
MGKVQWELDCIEKHDRKEIKVLGDCQSDTCFLDEGGYEMIEDVSQKILQGLMKVDEDIMDLTHSTNQSACKQICIPPIPRSCNPPTF